MLLGRPSLNQQPCQYSGQGPGTTLPTGAWVGLGDRVGQPCGVSGDLMTDVWSPWPATAGPAGPMALLTAETAQQGWECQAVMVTPCQSPVLCHSGATGPPGPVTQTWTVQAIRSEPWGTQSGRAAASGGWARWGGALGHCPLLPTSHTACLGPLMPPLVPGLQL